jgi:hypothetical protein
MTVAALGFSDLRAQVEELAQREPKLNADDLFVLWFLKAYITGSDEQARRAVAGGAESGPHCQDQFSLAIS